MIDDSARNTTHSSDPVLQVRYDVLVREIQRERAEVARLQSVLDAVLKEARKLREALGLEHTPAPKPARSMESGHG